jgi:hypothetical protein
MNHDQQSTNRQLDLTITETDTTQAPCMIVILLM